LGTFTICCRPEFERKSVLPEELALPNRVKTLPQKNADLVVPFIECNTFTSVNVNTVNTVDSGFGFESVLAATLHFKAKV
jgi:hypothetical protein